MTLEINFLFFPELFTSQFGHACRACPGMRACVHTHILTLLCQGLMIPKEFPYCVLSFTGARITRYCLWDCVSHITVSSPTFLIDQDTAAPVFSHLRPDGNSLSTMKTYEASSARLSSLLEAETAQPGQRRYPDTHQSCQAAGSWWDSCPDGFRGEAAPYSFSFTLRHEWKWTFIPHFPLSPRLSTGSAQGRALLLRKMSCVCTC